MSRDDTFNWSSHGSQNEDKTLQRSQRCHKGEFLRVSISTQLRSLRCRQWAFPESYTAGVCAWV